MAREPLHRQGNLRERIAHLAARIMAEDGIDDFGYAKRKAARQVGAHDARAMPDNEEIERALAAYRELYQQDEHGPLLASLRRSALEVMRSLSRAERAVADPDPLVLWARSMPFWDSIRTHPRFAEIMRGLWE